MRSTILTAILVLSFATPALAGDETDKSFQEITYKTGSDTLTIEPDGTLRGEHAGKPYKGDATPDEWQKLLQGPLSDRDEKAIGDFYRHTTVVNLAKGAHPYDIEVTKSFFHHYYYKGFDTIMDDDSSLLAGVCIGMLDRLTGGAILHGTTITGTVQYGDFDDFLPAVSVRDDAGNVYFLDGIYGGATLRPEDMGLKVGERVTIYGKLDSRTVDTSIGRSHDVTMIKMFYPPTPIAPASATCSSAPVSAPTLGMSKLVESVANGAPMPSTPAASAPVRSASAASASATSAPREARRPVPALDRPLGE
jgi:hypothetical protein